jgi:tetratricopeptide (TPR) repeat protein
MLRVANGCVVVSFLALCLVYDPVSLKPLSPGLPLALLGFALALTLHALSRQRDACWHPMDTAVGVFLLFVSAQCAASPAPLAAGSAWLLWLLTIEAYCLGRLCDRSLVWATQLSRLTILALAVAGISLLGSFRQPAGELTVPTSALVSSLTNPDYLAGWLVLTIPIAATGSMGTAFGVVGLVCLGWTLSRAAWLALLVAFLLVRMPKRRVGALLALLVLGAALAGGSGASKLFGTNTLKKRLVIYSVATRLTRDAPWLGHGPGRFGELYERSHPPRTEPALVPRATEWAHNVFLQIAVEMGLCGLVLALGLLLYGARFLSGPLTTQQHALALGLLAFLLHNQASVTAYILPVRLLAALFLGAALRTDTQTFRAFPPLPVFLGALAFLNLCLLPWALSRNRALHLGGQAERLAITGQAAKALPFVRQALEESPADPHLRYLLAGCLVATGKSLEGLVQYELVAAIYPEFGQLLYNQARALVEIERPVPALRLIQSYLEREPTFFEGHYLLGECLFANGEISASERALKKAISLAPPDPQLRHQLEELLSTVTHTGEAPTSR